MATANSSASGTGAAPAWWSLGCLMVELTTGTRAPFVAEFTLPAGASPALHVHAELDDSFYVLDGQIVLRCGDDVSLGGPGSWVPFPKAVPHTFRVMDGPARVLLVQGDDSFVALARELGTPAPTLELPPPGGGPDAETLTRALTRHGITDLGPPMEEAEARSYLDLLVG